MNLFLFVPVQTRVSFSLKCFSINIVLNVKRNFVFEGGTELACTFSIDFTASNGSPNNPDSLHFYSPYGGTVNQYEMAIRLYCICTSLIL
jgi:hypothetical protein